jgi:putative ABC transport system substrate-binding protein
MAARGQQPTTPVIGLLSGGSPGPFAQRVVALREGLKEIGFIEGQNVTIEYRWAEEKPESLSVLAADTFYQQ